MIGLTVSAYSWAYWRVILAAFALLVVNIFDDGALWNYLVIVLVAIAPRSTVRLCIGSL
jgi:hypothetical protein